MKQFNFRTLFFTTVVALFSITLSSQEDDGSYLPGGLKMRGDSTAMRAKCVTKNESGECLLAHLFLTGLTDTINRPMADEQITAFPIALTDINQFKLTGHFYSFITLDDYALSAQLDGVNWVFLPITAAADAIGYGVATPFFWIAKGITNSKYKRFIRAFQGAELLPMVYGRFNIIADEVCAMGRTPILEKIQNEIGFFRTARLPEGYSNCGVKLLAVGAQ